MGCPLRDSDGTEVLRGPQVMRFDRVYQTEVSNVRALIHGHVTLSVPKKLGNVLFIDTGGWMPGKGHFTFVELRSLELIRGPGPDVRFGSSRNR